MRQRNEEHFQRKFEFATGTNGNELIKHSRKNSVTYTYGVLFLYGISKFIQFLLNYYDITIRLIGYQKNKWIQDEIESL